MWNAWFDRGGVFAEFDALARELEESVRRGTADAVRVNVAETPEGYTLTADVPGLRAEDVTLDVQAGTLTLKAERAIAPPKGYEARHRERPAWRLARTFALPDDVNVDLIAARLDHGRLAVTLPKRPVAEPRRIPITA